MTTTIRFRFLGCNAIARASFAGVGGVAPGRYVLRKRNLDTTTWHIGRFNEPVFVCALAKELIVHSRGKPTAREASLVQGP